MSTQSLVVFSILVRVLLLPLLVTSTEVHHRALDLPHDEVHYVRNAHQCYGLCVARGMCVSLDYDVRTRQCALFFNTKGGSLQFKQNSVHMNIVKNVQGSGCGGGSCGLNQMCITTQVDTYQCLHFGSVVCDVLPSLPNGEVSLKPFHLNTVAEGSCFTDYQFFGSSQQITCQKSGNWTSLSGSCERIAFYNLSSTPARLPIPATVVPGWKVEMIGRIRDESRMIINTKYPTGYTAFHLEVRNNYNREVNVVLRTAKTAKGWAEGNRTQPYFPFKIGRLFNMTYAITRDAFDIYVDERYFVSYPHLVNVSLITEIVVEFGVDMDSVIYFY